MDDNKQKNIAMFIDCDNVSSKYIESIFDDLSQYGKVNIRKAYGDWTSDNLNSWSKVLQDYNIQPYQQFAYTEKKNASDIAIVIDVMDSIYTKNIDFIALITSDSDFTPLVTRILSDGISVYGYGEAKTPKALVNACSQFIYVENFLGLQQSNRKIKNQNLEQYDQNNEFKNSYQGEKYDAKKDYKLKKSLIQAVDKVCDNSGWADLKDVGLYVGQNSPFSPINHGFKKLGALIKYLDIFDVQYINNNLTMLVRIKDYMD
ncbi:MAG: NYN domain-containing protein [Campylobacterota bacterium]|nr:NYN domain-containing protein [Campylobacterota bacterium]